MSRPLNFTERQGNAIVTAITILAAVIILLAIGSALWLIIAFLRTFSSVFLPLAVGAVIALVFRPYYLWLNERARLPAPQPSRVLVLVLVLVVALIVLVVGDVILFVVVIVVGEVELVGAQQHKVFAALRTTQGIALFVVGRVNIVEFTLGTGRHSGSIQRFGHSSGSWNHRIIKRIQHFPAIVGL